jgi:hypothetical protein
MTYKHEHKVGIRDFNRNFYSHIKKLDKDTDLIITNRNQAVYTVSLAASDFGASTMSDPDQTTVASTLDAVKKKKGKK